MKLTFRRQSLACGRQYHAHMTGRRLHVGSYVSWSTHSAVIAQDEACTSHHSTPVHHVSLNVPMLQETPHNVHHIANEHRMLHIERERALTFATTAVDTHDCNFRGLTAVYSPSTCVVRRFIDEQFPSCSHAECWSYCSRRRFGSLQYVHGL